MPEYGMSAGSPMSGYAPQVTTQQDFMGVPEMSAQQTDPSVYDNNPEAMPDPASVQTANNAAQTGQKEVFDASMISGLLKAVRDTTLVDRYLGDLMKALDSLGRLMMSFYYHQEEFADRYGQSEMPEMEDALRNSFEDLGDLVISLRTHSVEPDEADTSDPGLEDAAGS
jgi:hypothetical protein